MFWWPNGFSDLCFGVWITLKTLRALNKQFRNSKIAAFLKLKWDSYTGVFFLYVTFSVIFCSEMQMDPHVFNLCVLSIPFKTKNNVIMYLYIQWWISRSFYSSYCVSLDSNWRLSRFKKKHTLPAWLTWTIDVIVPRLMDCP